MNFTLTSVRNETRKSEVEKVAESSEVVEIVADIVY